MVFGGRRPEGLALDPRVAVVDLPDLPDAGEGSVHLGSDPVLAERSRSLSALLSSEPPDAVLVDYLPLGLGGELMEALVAARGSATRFAWGVPYPGVPRPRPRNPRVREALGRYDVAVAYSSPGWMDPFATYEEYGLPSRREWAGVVVPPALPRVSSEVPVVVGLAGAGLGAASLFSALLSCAAPLAASGRLRLRLVAGVFHEASALVAHARSLPGVEVLERGGAEETTRDAAVVVARCGYMTAYSVARLPAPVVFVPWPSADPRFTEQYDRAKALATLPGIRWVDEVAPGFEASLGAALEASLSEGCAQRVLPFSTEGARETARLLLS